MALDKAKDFVLHLKGDSELQKKMSGFSLDELKEATEALKDLEEFQSSGDKDLLNKAINLLGKIEALEYRELVAEAADAKIK